jgi:3-methylcrotonyl-CoA carboxylase alpha subunit
MFTKILIANRGEIAVRVMATCREMGIRTVAVYSEADRHAMHVRQAGEAYCIGPAPAVESYLRIDKIIEVARECGAEAIHPGYGFLSENPAFVAACEQAGIAFVGPPAAAMRLMGSKIAAKQLAISVDAPVIPGYNGEQQDDETLARAAERVGYPLLIKASAGGGGKGMREVYEAADFREQVAGARREALAAFGDGTVFLERLLRQPRHVEIQILGDTHGNLIHLGERECSIQRRHQKIVEESPSVALTPALRAEMGAAAVRIASAAGYVNAGTMEFMLDQDRRFYFLEMNTRLQVEHPVTELVTGFDLVRHQLLIAAGEPLGIAQEQVQPRGHAIEVRLYAEDPEQDFLPSTGTISHFVQLRGPGIRLDSGIETGDEISQYYDPMIAKLIVYAEDRPAAIARLCDALEQCAIFGVKTNTPLLHSIATHPAFQEGLTHTSFLIEHHLMDTPAASQQAIPRDALIAAAFCDSIGATENELVPGGSSLNPWQTLGPWRMIGEARQVCYTYQDHEYRVAMRATTENKGMWNVQVYDEPAETISCMFGNDGLVLLRDGAAQTQVYVQRTDEETHVALRGRIYRLARRRALTIEATSRGKVNPGSVQKTLTAPMAGTIVKVNVHDGDNVEQRQALVILSAMKMEHTIAAPYCGTVRHVFYQEGAVVPGGAAVVEME